MRTKVISIVMAILSSLVVMPRHASAERLFVSVFIDTPGPRGGVAVVGDSVMLGSAYAPPFESGWGPSLAQMLADRGWGPVRMAAGVGFQAGSKVAANPGANMSLWLASQRAGGFDPSVIVASMGPNDILACAGDVNCAAADIRGFMDAAGVDHEVWWALQTTERPEMQAAWNQALQIVAGERPNLTLWDWPAARSAAGIASAPDNTHLPGPTEYRQRSAMIADDVTARMGVSRHVLPGEVTPPPADVAYQYKPVAPERVVDTRKTGARIAGGATLTVDLSALPSAAVGPDTAAVAVNVTAADPASAGFLTVWPCDGAQPLASSVNFLRGQARGAQATTLLSASRTLCVFSNVATDIVVDLQGVFVSDGALRFDPVAPARAIDTRIAGRASTIVIPSPPNARAVAATLTVTGGSTAGFLAAYPCSGSIPEVSNVNWQPGETVAGAVFVPVAADGTFCVFTNSPVDVIVDITGVFSDTGTLRFVAAPPRRMVDTRVGTGGWRGRQGVGQTIEIGVAPDAAQAVTGTITMVNPGMAGYLTGTTCGQPVGATSSVNGARGTVMANSLTVGLSPGGNLCINSLVGAHTLFDTTGWWVP